MYSFGKFVSVAPSQFRFYNTNNDSFSVCVFGTGLDMLRSRGCEGGFRDELGAVVQVDASVHAPEIGMVSTSYLFMFFCK